MNKFKSKPKSILKLLHLSDIHLRKKDDSEPKQFRQRVKGKLIEAVTTHVKEHSVPDFVAVTGDIAFSGKKKEYDFALEFFKELRDALPGETKFLVIPGNHDVDR
ncbi:MAG: metallophosphoesterase, partial [bacterium]|nr:metallophosphoesterase [bacterium]